MISNLFLSELMKFMWQEGWLQHKENISTDGERIVIHETGIYDADNESFKGVEALVDGVMYRGDVYFRDLGSDDNAHNNNAILQITTSPVARIYNINGKLIPQIIAIPDQRITKTYERLLNFPDGCKSYMAQMEDVKRIHALQRIFTERFERKASELALIHYEGQSNWNYTMYVMLFRAMAGNNNKEAFTTLARTISYSIVSRERASLLSVEALLLGGSGLLQIRSEDNYIVRLKNEFDHLRRKHDIKPMRSGVWERSRTNPNNSPVLRIAQLAAFLSNVEFIFDNIIKCRTPEDLHRLFKVEASEYWSEHFAATGRKHIGHDKIVVLGINLVAPLMFAYASFMENRELHDATLELLENIECEKNSIVSRWLSYGVTLTNAIDSQAIIELNNNYCSKQKCAICPVGRNIMRGCAK